MELSNLQRVDMYEKIRIEKLKTENKYDAMKEALVNSFSSVTSSGLSR